MKTPSTEEIVTKLRRDCMYWAPEQRVSKLMDYLDAYGEALWLALCALPAEERDAMGVTHVFVGGPRR